MLALSFLPKEIRLRVMMSQLDAVRAQDYIDASSVDWVRRRAHM